MSHTNTTTNYNLPQFVGTDKPAWLTDINGAFSSIDTAIKGAKDTADTGSASATSALNKIGDLTTLTTTAKTDVVAAVNEVKSDAGTAQTTANTAIGSANATATALNTFEQKFNLTNITDGNLNNTTTTGVVRNYLKLAQNNDGSIFKMYGVFQINPNSSATRSAVAGLSGYYGVDSGLILTSAPTTAYMVQCAGVQSENNESNSASVQAIEFAVGTNGHIYVCIDDTNTNARPYGSGRAWRNMFFPCIYFNGSFGDTPTPED